MNKNNGATRHAGGTSPVISEQSVILAFCDRLAEHGIRLADPSRLELDGQWHRANVDGDRGNSKNLSYKIYFDDRPAGYFEDHKRGVTGTFSLKNGHDLSPADRAAAQIAWQAAQRKREEEQARRHADAANRAREAMQAATGDPALHPYIQRKGITPKPGAVGVDDQGLLLIPLYQDFGVIASVQTISADGEKLFLPGGKIAGSFHSITGTDKSRVLVAEGYATGAALNQVTGYSVACAMSAGNMAAVVKAMQRRFPDREIVACADNDWSTFERTGRNPGVEAVAGLGVRVLAPQFAPDADPKHTDWDDWLRAGGDPEEIREMIRGSAVQGLVPTACLDPTGASDMQTVDGAIFDLDQDAFQDELQEPDPDELRELYSSARPPAKPSKKAAREVSGELVDIPNKPDDVQSLLTKWGKLGLELNGNGLPSPNLNNATYILSNDPMFSGQIWFDEFLGRVLTTWNRSGDVQEWTDADDIKLTLTMQRVFGIGRMAVATVRDAVTAVAMANRRNEVRDWLESISWDGRSRLSDLIPVAFGSVRNPYTEAVGRCWLVSMVARVLEPGCKVDTMPVFEGVQGIRKSTAMQELVGKRWFAESSESPTSKDFFQVLQGKWLVEISEMDAFSRSEVNTIKRVITCRVDRYRAPYGRRAEDHPRMSVFAGTTNKDDWNRDETGARRFWPVSCTGVDIGWIQENRTQLFAEALTLFRLGRPWWDVPDEDAMREQENRRDTDEWEPVIEHWLRGNSTTTAGDVLAGALDMKAEKWTKADQMRVGKCLRAIGWKRIVAWEGGSAVRKWVRAVTL